MSETRIPVNEEYKYGFHDEDVQYGKGTDQRYDSGNLS